MDREAFDGLARLLATSPTRRAALGALLGAGLAGPLGAADAKKKKSARKRGSHKKARGGPDITAQAVDCSSPGPSSTMNGCDFDGEDFSGDNLSGSRIVGTTFRNAELTGTNLSSSNMKDASFRGADLTCANLRSSTLKNADFRGFAAPGANTDLTGANLSSSGCGGIQFNGRTHFCRTRMCNGSVNDEDCPGDFDPEGFCCTDEDCPGLESCVDHRCECLIEEAEAECAAGNQRLDPETCICRAGLCVPEQCESGNNACRTCSCSGPDFCVCLLVGCSNGPCHPVTGCPQCVPAECESRNDACQTCSCTGGGACICGLTVCEHGACDPQTGCPPAPD
jgi:hypothetical protein